MSSRTDHTPPPQRDPKQGKGTQKLNGRKTAVPSGDIVSEMEPKVHSGSHWPKPQPFTDRLLSVLSVSPLMIPERLRPWLIDISERMKCPLDFVASATVVMLSSLIGTRLSIKPKQKDSWTITPNLWGAAIGDPSTMKTPSIQEVFTPLKRLIAESRKQYEEQKQQYEAEQVTYEAQKKVYLSQEQDRLKGKKVNSPVGFPEPLPKPTERRYMTNDATIEKVADLLNENPTCLLQFRDELIGMLASWDKSGHEQDRAFYLEAWNGNGSITIDRIGRGTTHVDNLCIALYGGIQPVKLLGYLKAAMEYDNDGFVQRLQVAVFPDKPRWDYTDETPDRDAKNRAFLLIQQIVDSDFRHIAFDADEYDRFPYTRFDADAQEIFKQWLIKWETSVLPNEAGLLLEHFTKYRSLMPSLALIFHVVDCVDLPQPIETNGKYLVSASAARMAVEWCTYLQTHARRIYGLLDTQHIEAAKSLLKHLKAGHLQDGFKARDVQRKQWANLTTLEMVESALTELSKHHWLREVEPPPSTGGRPETSTYLINPIIIQNV